MSMLTSLDYDKCTYAHNLSQSVGPGQYYTQTPMPHCEECISDAPRNRLAKQGNSKCENVPLIDVDSELAGITRKASKCPFDKYVASKAQKAFCDKLKHMPRCKDEVLITEDTRFSNPPCTLRGTPNGFNRWEWLCRNPQERVGIPFDVQVNSRTLTKDNHRPIIPTPMDNSAVLPPLNHSDAVMSGLPPPCTTPLNHPASTQWRKCAEIRRY
jgi:hypothetical protein